MGCGASTSDQTAPISASKPVSDEKKAENQSNTKDSKQMTPKK
jgi:hypothetical protein